MADLKVDFGKFQLKNPVMTASGTFGYGLEYSQFYDISRLGAIVVKGIRSVPSDGNPTPRVAEVTGGMLNAIGLQGPGVEKFLNDEHYLPGVKKTGATVIVNIWGKTAEEYAEVAARLEAEAQADITALEINISCPNVKAGGAAFGTDPKLAEQVISAVRSATTLPLITKLSPNVTSIAEFARIAEACGSDAVSLINTISAMSIDIETRRTKLANRTGGLSGPAVKPVAVRMVNEVYRAVKLPIIGMGGICNGADAVEFMIAGATAVAVGTANFVDPFAPLQVIDFINEYCDRHGIKSVAELTGSLLN
ncbi:MAG: dihydroorotate dehydrogenase [Lentisphaerae bacterium]|nr:dihydroorotate dehydrogenase [Lentisphaerota bacterium]